MRRPLGSRLLQGAATTAARITAIAALVAAATSAPLAAQSAATGQLAKPSLNIAITYSALRANQISSTSFWMQGGSVQIEGRFYHGLGAVADVTSLHVANINSTGVGLDLVTATFGPRYTWSSARYEFYAQALAGTPPASTASFHPPPAPTPRLPAWPSKPAAASTSLLPRTWRCAPSKQTGPEPNSPTPLPTRRIASTSLRGLSSDSDNQINCSERFAANVQARTRNPKLNKGPVAKYQEVHRIAVLRRGSHASDQRASAPCNGGEGGILIHSISQVARNKSFKE